jgi:hypothetical protein
MNAPDQPLHAAAVDLAATQLGHSRLRNPEPRREEMLRLWTERAHNLARELLAKVAHRVARCSAHSSSKLRPRRNSTTKSLRPFRGTILHTAHFRALRPRGNLLSHRTGARA